MILFKPGTSILAISFLLVFTRTASFAVVNLLFVSPSFYWLESFAMIHLES